MLATVRTLATADTVVHLRLKYLNHEYIKVYADLRLPDGGVNALEDGDGEGGGLARAGLRLGDHVPPLIHLYLAQTYKNRCVVAC